MSASGRVQRKVRRSFRLSSRLRTSMIARWSSFLRTSSSQAWFASFNTSDYSRVRGANNPAFPGTPSGGGSSHLRGANDFIWTATKKGTGNCLSPECLRVSILYLVEPAAPCSSVSLPFYPVPPPVFGKAAPGACGLRRRWPMFTLVCLCAPFRPPAL